MRNAIFILFITVVVSLFSQTPETLKHFFIGFEGKYSTKKTNGVEPFGLGGNCNFRVGDSKFYWGGELDLEFISSWTETLDLSQSPDTLEYDRWTKQGTDIFIAIAPQAKYRFLSYKKLYADFALSAGGLIYIQSYNEVKTAEDNNPRWAKSKNPAKTEFYLKPRLAVGLNRFYIAYEYFGIADYLEHTFNFGVTF